MRQKGSVHRAGERGRSERREGFRSQAGQGHRSMWSFLMYSSTPWMTTHQCADADSSAVYRDDSGSQAAGCDENFRQGGLYVVCR